MEPNESPKSDPLKSQVHLWQHRWFRDLMVLLMVAMVVFFFYQVRAVVLPVVVGLALAYVFNPPISWAHRRLKCPRWLGTGLIVAAVFLSLLAASIWAIPIGIDQSIKLAKRLPGYARQLADKLQVDLEIIMPVGPHASASASQDAAVDEPDKPLKPLASLNSTNVGLSYSPKQSVVRLTTKSPPSSPSSPSASTPSASLPSSLAESSSPASSNAMIGQANAPANAEIVDKPATTRPVIPIDLSKMELSKIGSTAGQWLGWGFGLVGSAVGLGTYLALAGAVSLICFLYFSWKYQGILDWFDQFIPRQHRDRTLAILSQMDMAVSAWLRGRLIQASLLGIEFSIGWAIVGVPYWLLLGLLGGLLSVIPYAAMTLLPIAIGVTWADSLYAGQAVSLWHVAIWPAAVYFLSQGIDGWVVEPLVQGKATSLDPVTILLAVLMGGAAAGVLGMILAIPVAACVKILARELVIPRLRAVK